MAKKVFITRKIPEIGIKMLRDKGYEVDVYPKDEIIGQRKLIKFLKKGNYDAVVTLLTDKIDTKIFDVTPNTKLFVNYATGFDNIDISEAKRREIIITNAPAELSSEAVAEHTIALMLALAARIVEADESIRRGKYKGWAPMNFIGTDILGKTLGLIGLGRIGSRVAHYAKGLGMKILYYDINKNKMIEDEVGATFCNSIEEILKKSDIVSLHIPLTDTTKHLINESSLKTMKPGAFLINTSRGPIIDEIALVKVLKNKIISAAALDVFENEPKLAPGLADLQNVILTPHIGSASIQAREQMAEIVANNVIDYFEGRHPRNDVTVYKIQ